MMRVPLVIKFRKEQNHEIRLTSEIVGMHDKMKSIQNKVKEAADLLDKGTAEYNRLYRSRMQLLVRMAELLIKYERMNQSRIARDIQNILEDEGVERFEPAVGDPIQVGKCRVNKMEYNGVAPGMVASVQAPGFFTSAGEVILLAEVFECIVQTGSDKNVSPSISNSDSTMEDKNEKNLD